MGKKFLKASTLMAMPAFAALLSLPLLNGMTVSAAAAEDEVPAFETEIHAMGDFDADSDYVGSPAPSKKKMLFSAKDSASLPSSIDLSTSPYFPPIGDQMYVGSCYAWSSAYYQYTFMANKMNDVVTTAENAYSPSYVYNFRTSTRGMDGYGGTCTDAYKFMMEHGCLHMSEMPYQTVNGSSTITESNYDYSLSTDTDAMIDALHTRITGHDALTISAVGTEITGPRSASLNAVKKKLADGSVLSIRVTNFNGWEYATRKLYNETTGAVSSYRDQDGNLESVCIRAINGSSDGHALTVVGYDDSVWVDINNDGMAEQGEYGAFKIANSWGTSYRNHGYTWVSYDALNGVSSVSGNWEANKRGTRIGIFDRGVSVNGQIDVNGFYFIEVGNKDVYYVAQVDVESNNAVNLDVRLYRDTPTGTGYTSRYVLDNTPGRVPVAYSGTLAFDYAALCDPIGNYLSDYTWGIGVNSAFENISARITDDLSNTIVDFGDLSVRNAELPVNLVNGDLNYDGQFTQADIDIKNSGAELSTLQKYLAADMPTLPDQPDTPDTPDVPDTPDTPDVPDTPDTPDVPDTPDTPDVPDTPDTPDVPASVIATASVVTEWDGGKVIMVTVKNTGTTPINGWTFRFDDLGGEIVSIWNANLLSGKVIQNASYNAQIPAGGEITFGYQIVSPNGTMPAFTLVSQSAAAENCTVLLDIANAWDGGFVGYITVQNDSDTALNGFELKFRTEGFTITDACGSNITNNADGSYTLTSSATVAAHSSIAIQIVGASGGTPQIQVISLNTTALN